MKHLYSTLFILSLVLNSCTKTNATAEKDTSMVLISADNPLIQYIGRIDFSDKKRPSFSYPGVSISARFEGPAIDVVLTENSREAANPNYYNIIIDGSLHTVLETKEGTNTYKISRTLKDTIHTIEVFKRTESSVGRGTFNGFKIASTKKILEPIAKPKRIIEFIGDSFTCGYGDELSIEPPPTGNPNVGFHSKNENNYLAYGNLVCKNLNAQYYCTAISGRGMYRNNWGSLDATIPDIYSGIFPDEKFPKWNTASVQPDVVVIHLGANDFFPESVGNKLDSAGFVSTHIKFVKTLRGYYPKARIVCVLTNALSDYWPEGTRALTRCKSYIHKVVDESQKAGLENVYYFELPTQQPPYGEDWHPSLATQKDMADRTEVYLKKLMGW